VTLYTDSSHWLRVRPAAKA